MVFKEECCIKFWNESLEEFQNEFLMDFQTYPSTNLRGILNPRKGA